MLKYLKTSEGGAIGITGSWGAVAWSWIDPLYGILQIIALLAAITASVAYARYYIKKGNEPRNKD
jgi:hypothetical protein